MRTLLWVVAAVTLFVSFTLRAQQGDAEKGGGKGKGGGGAAIRNLQILSEAAVPAAMQSFVKGLGLLDKGTCNYCHTDDRSSDEKPQKVVARRMIAMVRELNARFQDGKPHITCFTCHRGNVTPEMLP